MAEASESESAPKRRARRSTGTRTTRTTRTTRGAARSTTTRRRAGSPGDAVASLTSMVDELIKENRKLKRQLDRLTAKGRAAASSGSERGLKSIQRRVQKALAGAATPKRRATRTASGTIRRAAVKRAPTTRRRRTSTGGEATPS